MDLIDPQALRHRISRHLVIPCQHHNADSVPLQLVHGIGRGVFDGIGYPDQTCRFAVIRREHHRLTLITQGVRAGAQIGNRHIGFLE